MVTITQAEPVLGIKVMGTFSLSVPSASFHHLLCPQQWGVWSWLPWQRVGTAGTALAQNTTKFPLWQEVKNTPVWGWGNAGTGCTELVADALNLETFKATLDRALSNGAQWKLSLHTAEGWAGWILKISSNINHSVILQAAASGYKAKQHILPPKKKKKTL